ncbi:MAG: hypothetical protein JSV80_03040 [Acidobacteriota bacterium]|nr:MAG: hypothetical protein JSV80_03040 [Acidobacteriota bacterium]
MLEYTRAGRPLESCGRRGLRGVYKFYQNLREGPHSSESFRVHGRLSVRGRRRSQGSRDVHVGTLFVEREYLSEDDLGQALAELHDVRCAGREQIELPPAELLKRFPEGLVRKHRVIPLRRLANKLHVAMVDPHDVVAIEEISFVTDCEVIPQRCVVCRNALSPGTFCSAFSDAGGAAVSGPAGGRLSGFP